MTHAHDVAAFVDALGVRDFDLAASAIGLKRVQWDHF
jgi:hypothetical protein